MKSLNVLASTLFVVSHVSAQSAFLDTLGSAFGVAGNATFDYVVVGAGTAGSSIAARLAQNNNTVALVEAGSFYQILNGNRSVIPGYANFRFPILSAPVTDWGILTTPQPGLNGNLVPYARGQTIGGSSGISFLMHLRTNRGAHDQWALDVGDDSWSWDSVLPYYEKSTTFTAPDRATFPNGSYPSFNEATFGGGPVQVSYGAYTPPILDAYMKGFNEAGIPSNADLNSGELLGSNWLQSFIDPKTQYRSSGQTAYLNPLLGDTSPLTMYSSSRARRVIFSEDKVATGVEITTGRATYTLNAAKEVILSAGAFQSPQLLMVSGVGPQATLDEFGIPTVAALEGVGQNLQDHPIFSITYANNQPSATSYDSFQGADYAAAEQEYLASRTGPLSSNKYVVAFEKFSKGTGLSASTMAALSRLSGDWPDYELRVQPSFLGPQDPKEQYTTVYATLQAPLSLGTVGINSTSTDDLPIVDVAYYSDPADMEMAIAAFKRIRQVAATPSVAGVTASEYLPGDSVADDADIEQFIRNTTNTIFNAAGTTKMGKANDSMAVVDTQARVFGVQNLRVVDVGIAPFVIPGHAISTAYMLGEKIADSILSGAV
ncbi:unnamed protein product [Discula destructiva]